MSRERCEHVDCTIKMDAWKEENRLLNLNAFDISKIYTSGDQSTDKCEEFKKSWLHNIISLFPVVLD